MTEISSSAIVLPTDTSKSRLQKPTPKPEPLDDVATAGERIEAFWAKYPDGSILTEVETEHAGEYAVYTVRAYIRRKSESERPDTTAHATRGSYDPEPIVAQFPQETAETSAISRALRNLGILATPKKPTPELEVSAAHTSPLASARGQEGLSQKTLAAHMRAAGFQWTQATVSKIERGTRALSDDEVQALRGLGLEIEP